MVEVSFNCGIGFAGPVLLQAAETVDLSTVDGNQIMITGATPISSFGNTPNLFRIVNFLSQTPLVNSSALTLALKQNRTTNSGDYSIFVSDAAGSWHEVAAPPLALPSILNSINGIFGARNIGLNITNYTAVATYSPSAGLLFGIGAARGGGGAGGGVKNIAASQGFYGGGGGGQGGLGIGFFLPADVAGGVPVTPGAAGVAASGASGGNGGASSLGSLISGSGGTGGFLNSWVSPDLGQGGAGGRASGSRLLFGLPGQAGQAGGLLLGTQPNTTPFSAVVTAGGQGGGASSNGALTGSGGTANAGGAGGAPGDGGGGASAVLNTTAGAMAPGGVGIAGFVAVCEFLLT